MCELLWTYDKLKWTCNSAKFKGQPANQKWIDAEKQKPIDDKNRKKNKQSKSRNWILTVFTHNWPNFA